MASREDKFILSEEFLSQFKGKQPNWGPVGYFTYKRTYARQIENENRTEEFWETQAQTIPWIAPYKTVWTQPKDGDFVGRWFDQGKLNVADVCVDRWAKKHGNETALIWVGEEDSQNASNTRVFSYQDLSLYINQVANYLKISGVKKGDRVGIWMPMV